MLEPITDAQAALWGMKQLAASPHQHRVCSLVPRGFERYARIFHPAWQLDGGQCMPIRWAAMAASTGSHVHALMQWRKIATPTLGGSEVVAPDEGTIPAAVSLPMLDLLSSHTGRDACWLGVWQGWGRKWKEYRIQAPQATKSIDTGGGPERGVFHSPAWKWDVFGSSLKIVFSHLLKGVGLTAKTSAIDTWGGRTYDMFRAPLKMAFSPVFKSVDQTANLIWAADRSWWLTNDIDLNTSYIGGNARLIDSLLASDDLEVWPARPEDEITLAADRLNREQLDSDGGGGKVVDLSFLSEKELARLYKKEWTFLPNGRGKLCRRYYQPFWKSKPRG